MEQLKGEMQVGGQIWAPGLLGTASLRPVLGGAMRQTLQEAVKDSVLRAKAAEAAATVLGEPTAATAQGRSGEQRQGQGQGATWKLAGATSALRPHGSAALDAMKQQSNEAKGSVQRCPEQEGDGEA